MNLLALIVYEIACALAMIAAMHIYLRRKPLCVDEHATQVALLCIAAGSFGGILAPFYRGFDPSFGDILFRVGVAILSVRGLIRSFGHRRPPSQVAT